MAIKQHRQKIAWILVYTLWIIADVEFVWGWDSNHVTFLLLASVGTIALLFAEFENVKPAFMGSAVALIVALLVFIFAPPTLPTETEIHGWLQPANDPMPLPVCAAKMTEESMLVAFGNMGFIATAKFRRGQFKPTYCFAVCGGVSHGFVGFVASDMAVSNAI